MSVTTRLLTADELDQFPDDGKRREIIAGELYVSPAPSPRHQRVSSLLHVALFDAVERSGWGQVLYSPIDVRFTALDQVQPDLLVIAGSRLEIIDSQRIEGAPDVVVEILSPSNPTYDEVEKAQLYARAGVPEYWILDPAARTFRMQRLDGEVYVPVELVDGILRSTVIPEFEIDPDKFFGLLDL